MKPEQNGNGASGQQSTWRARFRHWSEATAKAIGLPIAFFASLMVVLLWAVCGPFFGFSDTWQLIINTGTTIVTFLVVFLIQNTQNRDTDVINLKLDELLRAIEGEMAGRYGGIVSDDLQLVQQEIHSRIRSDRSNQAASDGKTQDA